MSFPWHDWQFWAVTAAAAGGLWTLVRPLLPQRGKSEAPCGHCAAGSAACAAPTARARLEDASAGGASRLRVLRDSEQAGASPHPPG